ncbi:MAG: DMT family transporter [Pseudomonadales bacterium]
MSTLHSHMGLREWAMLIALSILWGGSFFSVALAVPYIQPITLVALRVALAGAALWLFIGACGIRVKLTRQILCAFLCMGILNNVIPFSLITWGQTEVASGLASILNATTPMFTVLIAHFYLADEPASPQKILGVICGFVGVTVMLGDAFIEDSSALVPLLAIAAGTLSYACAGVYGRRFKTLAVNPVVTAAGQVSASAVLMLPTALMFETWPSQAPVEAWLAVAALALLSTALAYVLYFKLLARAGATNLLLVTLLIPISAIALGSIFLGEQLTASHYAGMGLIALGLCAIDGRVWARLQRVTNRAKHL